MKTSARLSLMLGLLAWACGHALSAQATDSPVILPGGQDAAAAHPGTITWVYLWNDSRKVEPAENYDDRFKFFCLDANGDVAVKCIPIVEIVTLSVDENGNPVVPNEADSIEISTYGPGHTFVQHTSSAPNLKQLRKQNKQPSMP
jgi:hypothetical protein